MARSWSLIDIFSGYRPNVYGWLCQPDTFDIVYYINSDHDAVLSWEGVGTEADISDATFTTDFELHGICWFKSDLYVLAEYWTGSVWEYKIYKYSGSGTTWNEVWDGSGENIQLYKFTTTPSYPGNDTRFLDCDQDYMFVRGNARDLGGGDTDKKTWASTDGSTWNPCQIDGSYDLLYPFGIASGSEYPRMLGDLFPTDEIAIRNEANFHFTGQGNSVTGAYIALHGYADDYVFAEFNYANDPLYYDDNWFLTSQTSANLDLNTWNTASVQVLGDDAIMICRNTDLNAFVWNTSTLQFDADGSIPDATRNIVGFFRFGSTLYALCGVGTTGYAYSGGAISNPFDPFAVVSTLASFYHGEGPGEGVLVEKFTLPFEAVNPGAMTLDQSLGTVVIGTKTGGAEAAIYSSHPYPTGTSFSEGHPTGTSVTSMKWI